MIAHVYMRTRWLIVPNLVGAVLSITFCALLIPRFGAEGVGAGLVLSGLAMVATMHVLLVRRAGGGGAPIRPVLMAGVSAAALWGLTLVLRYLLNSPGLGMIAGVLVLVSITYLGLQYIFLREHLEDSKKVT